MFTLQYQDGNKCNIGGRAPKGGARTVTVRERGTNHYLRQGFELDNNLNKYRRYFAFIDCRLYK